MVNVKNNVSAQDTKRKLIDAAGKVFAARGFHAATLKEITDLAQANSASVNYHFSDKAELYSAVVKHALSGTPESRFKDLKGSPSERLKAVVLMMLTDFSGTGESSWHAQVLAHELSQPTHALQPLLQEVVIPRLRITRGLIREILGPDITDGRISCGHFSVIAQCLEYALHRKLLVTLLPDLNASGDLDQIADHIVTFSLGGLKAMKRSKEVKRKRQRKQAE